MPHRVFACLLSALFMIALARPAAAEMNDRLSQQRFGAVTLGDYQAGDNVRFTLSRYRNVFLLHFAGETETYVLYADYGSLGGRVLRYDSGAIAIQVAGWGAMTIYPDNRPDGLPATRTGDAAAINMPSVGQSQVVSAADDEATHLAYVSGIHVAFTADWNASANDAWLRGIVYDTIGNTARGIARFAAKPQARGAFADRINTVRFQSSNKPLLQLTGKTLIVTYNASQGFMGRASSRAIAFALGKLFGLPISN
jgi:hypothetical protein